MVSGTHYYSFLYSSLNADYSKPWRKKVSEEVDRLKGFGVLYLTASRKQIFGTASPIQVVNCFLKKRMAEKPLCIFRFELSPREKP